MTLWRNKEEEMTFQNLHVSKTQDRAEDGYVTPVSVLNKCVSDHLPDSPPSIIPDLLPVLLTG